MKSLKFLIPAALSLLLFSCKQPDLGIETSIEVPVGVIEAGTSAIEEFIHTTGTVYPIKEVSLNSEMAGKYHLQKNSSTGKPYELGDFVKEGATIIRFDDEEYVNDLREKALEVDLEISRQEYEKQKALYDKGGATLRDLKNAEISLINTRYDIEGSRIDLAKMTVVAPFSGVIADLPFFTEGTRVASNTLLVRLLDYGKLYLESNLPEKYFTNVSRGLKVYVTSYTSPNDTLIGRITQISPAIDPDARTFKCIVNADNPKKTILPGMFVKADMVVNSSDSSIVIPKDIIVSRNRVKTVFVVERGVAKERRITTGLESTEMIEVLTGLEPGESVVSKGFETLRHDSKVKVLR